jgi:multimeric flavodoxin WrbA
MNILLINGSPRGENSNTIKLSRAFIEGIQAKTEATVEEVSLSTAEIRPCIGCFACWNKTPGACVIRDDMKEILEKILWADLTIWSFGLYFFQVPGRLKNLIDRMLPLVLPFMASDSETGGHPARYDMTGKRNVIISTCGFHTAKGNYGAVKEMFDHVFDTGAYEMICCGQGELFAVTELSARTDVYLKTVTAAGSEYVSGGITENTYRALEMPLYPKDQFEAMADASWGIEKDSGEKTHDDLIFTKQMAALYRKDSYPGKNLVLEMDYTDLKRSYQILLKKDGSEVLTDGFVPYTTKIETPYTVWRDIAAGKISGTEAMMQKLYRVDGDFDLMLHWDTYFGAGEADKPEQPKEPREKGSNMLLMLLPWIAFWIGAPIHAFYGSLAAIAVSVLIPLLFFRNRRIVYDVISCAAVTALSILLLLFENRQLLVPLSYLAFGLMWLVSCLTKIPLTAHYSMNDYNGEKALDNPLFMRTNRILTALWGVLYVVTAVWTFFLMRSRFSVWTAVVNNVLPVLMGIFTAWFQKWYPAWYAKKS